MDVNNIKNFFFLSAGIGILIWGGDRIYRTWRDGRELPQVVSNDNRKKMDRFYTDEFELIYTNYLNSPQLVYQRAQLNNSIKATEEKMIKDGYSYAEAGIIKRKVLNKINTLNRQQVQHHGK